MAARTQERRDALATKLSVGRMAPSHMGKTPGPQGMMRSANAVRHAASAFSADREHSLGSAPSTRPGQLHARFIVGEPGQGVYGMSHVDPYGTIGVGMDDGSTLFRGYTADSSHGVVGGMAREAALGGRGTRVTQLADPDAASSSQDNFHDRVEGPQARARIEHQTRFRGPQHQQMHTGATPAIRRMEMNSSDRRGFTAFDGGHHPSAAASALQISRARVARGVEARSHSTGVLSGSGAVFS